jgi:hypothetical protein
MQHFLAPGRLAVVVVRAVCVVAVDVTVAVVVKAVVADFCGALGTCWCCRACPADAHPLINLALRR